MTERLGRRLTALDEVSRVMDAPDRPLDFAIGIALDHAPSSEALERGLASARRAFPLAGARLATDRWVYDPAAHAPLTLDDGGDASIARWLATPMALERHGPVEQRLQGEILWTRAHHAALDGTSLALLVAHQLAVASGSQPAQETLGSFDPPVLRTHPTPVRRAEHAFAGVPDRLWRRPPTGEQGRGFRHLTVSAREARQAVRQIGGFTYNDLMLTVALDAALAWNTAHGLSDARALAVWVPMNARVQPFAGFGNGSSRIRIYARHDAADALGARCRAIRQQIDWSKQHGEWALPDDPWVMRLPRFLRTPILRSYLNRPTVDMGSFSFSHVERLDGGLQALAQSAPRRIVAIGPLHERYPFGLNACTLADVTHLTLTYDTAHLTQADADGFLADLTERLASAARELS